MRKNGKTDVAVLSEIEKEVSQNYSEEWLLHLEIVELVKDLPEGSDLFTVSLQQLEKLKGHSEEYNNLINEGLKLIDLNHEVHEVHEGNSK